MRCNDKAEFSEHTLKLISKDDDVLNMFSVPNKTVHIFWNALDICCGGIIY